MVQKNQESQDIKDENIAKKSEDIVKDNKEIKTKKA